MRVIDIKAEITYPVSIGDNWKSSLKQIIDQHNSIVLVATEFIIEKCQLNNFAQEEDVLLFEIPDGEAAKSIEVASAFWEFLGTHNIDRTAALVGIGGGATTDFTGFVAATWLRGVSWYAIPTTLAGMVDAAVGGKTGINTNAGKNLVGSFHSPRRVITDLTFLDSLSDRDFAAGLAEVIKCGLIGDPAIIELARSHPNVSAARSVAREFVERSVALKARVVSEDFTESDLREILNFGHTFGHAVEKRSRYELRHGEAVAVGIAFALHLSVIELGLDPEIATEMIALLTAFDLPTTINAELYPFETMREIMAGDKKTRSGELRFIGVPALGAHKRIVAPSGSALLEAYERITS